MSTRRTGRAQFRTLIWLHYDFRGYTCARSSCILMCRSVSMFRLEKMSAIIAGRYRCTLVMLPWRTPRIQSIVLPSMKLAPSFQAPRCELVMLAYLLSLPHREAHGLRTSPQERRSCSLSSSCDSRRTRAATKMSRSRLSRAPNSSDAGT